MLKTLKEEGHEVHYLLADLEFSSNHVRTKVDILGMLQDWDHVFTPPIFGLAIPGLPEAQTWLTNKPYRWMRSGLATFRKPYLVLVHICWPLKAPLWLVNKLYYFAKGRIWHLKKPLYCVKSHWWKIKRPYYYLQSSPSRVVLFLSPGLYETIRPVYRKLMGKPTVSGMPDTESLPLVDSDADVHTGVGVKAAVANGVAEAIELAEPSEDLSPTEIDKWYDLKLDRFVRKLHNQFLYEVVICEYVFMSRVLTNFQDDVLKVIDTHDVFTDRNRKFEAEGLQETFFSTTAGEEQKGLNRADKIIAIQDEEGRFFQELASAEVITIGHSVELLEPASVTETNKNILYLGPGNVANIHGVQRFLRDVLPRVRSEIPEAKLILAGQICQFIDDAEHLEKMGEVREVRDLYDRGDVVINPAVVGTGLKIKNLEAMGLGKILVTSCQSAVGFSNETNPFIIADTSDEFADAIIDVMTNVQTYCDIRRKAYEYARKHNRQTVHSLRLLLRSGDGQKVAAVRQGKHAKTEELRCTIFAFPRTGSSTLRKLFDLHPNLSCIHEPFNEDLSNVRDYTDNQLDVADIDSADQLNAVLERMFANKSVLKHLEVQLTPDLNRTLITYPGTKLIFLWRRNLLQRLVSNYISISAQYYHGDRSVILGKTFEPVPIAQLQRMLRRDQESIENWRTFAKQHAASYFELAYEDLYELDLTEEQKLVTLNEMFEFLGVGELTRPGLVAKAKDLLKPENSKLNSELTYRRIPNIRHIDELLGNDVTGRIFASRE